MNHVYLYVSCGGDAVLEDGGGGGGEARGTPTRDAWTAEGGGSGTAEERWQGRPWACAVRPKLWASFRPAQ